MLSPWSLAEHIIPGEHRGPRGPRTPHPVPEHARLLGPPAPSGPGCQPLFSGKLLSTTPSRHYREETGSLVKLTGPGTSRITLIPRPLALGSPAFVSSSECKCWGLPSHWPWKEEGLGTSTGWSSSHNPRKGALRTAERRRRARRQEAGVFLTASGTSHQSLDADSPAPTPPRRLPRTDSPPTYTHMCRDPRRRRKPSVSNESGVMPVHL